MKYKKYRKVKRTRHEETKGFREGGVWVFPKLDGTNAVIWLKDDGELGFGSRNKSLVVGGDNHNFVKMVYHNGDYENIKTFLTQNPKCIIYGEHLVKHSFKHYKEEVLNKFYMFDLYDTEVEEFVHFEDWHEDALNYNIRFIPSLCKLIDPDEQDLISLRDQNHYLCKEDKNGIPYIGEGIVCKNYGFRDKFSKKQIWVKYVTDSFKESHEKTFGKSEGSEKASVEVSIAKNFATPTRVNKVYDKIVEDVGSWNDKQYVRLFKQTFNDIIDEEIKYILRSKSNPTINFKLLYSEIIKEIKIVKSELF